MMLLISTCREKLSEMEFVRPIEKILEAIGVEYETRHYSETFDPSHYNRIIICGTSLKDFEYMEGDFSWIKDYQGKILGICSGAQMLAVAFGSELEEKTMIGSMKVEVTRENSLVKGAFNSYFLITKKPVLSENFVFLDREGSIFKHTKKEIYGLLFHPEVLNRNIIIDFLK